VQYTQSFQRRFQPPYYSAYIQTASRYVCACLTQPVGQAAFGLLYGLFAQCRAFCGGCCIARFQKSCFFYKIMNASLPIY
jgi:hypothetical protein